MTTSGLFQHRDEEAIRARTAWRHQPTLRRFQRGLLKIFRLVPEHASGLVQWLNRKFRMACQKAADLVAVFGREYRAGDIGDAAARLDQTARAIKHFGLVLQAN